MRIEAIPIGVNPPEDVNVIVEVPHGGHPVKYEMDKESGAMFVDRFIHTAMQYPANYGFIPQTLSGDGDPVDVLVVTPFPLIHGCVVRCRALGMLKMTDESGVDAKLVAVPVNKLSPATAHVTDLSDIGQNLLDQIKHFFEHYKALEAGKWVKVEGWGGIEEAHKEIADGVANYKK